ncbi:MAG: hypothetical protein Q9181_000465 [Wetmoreana brouardii]
MASTNNERDAWAKGREGSEAAHVAVPEAVQSSDSPASGPSMREEASKGVMEDQPKAMQPVTFNESVVEKKPAKQSEGDRTANPDSTQSSDLPVEGADVRERATRGNSEDQTASPDKVQTTTDNQLDQGGEQVTQGEVDHRTAPADTVTALDLCNNCLEPATAHCKQCGSAFYCSTRCQKADWTYHKQVCSQYKHFKDRPKAGCVRALLFPEEEAAPRWVWLAKTEDPLNLEYVSDSLEVKHLLGVSNDKDVEQQRIMRGLRRAKRQEPNAAHFVAFLLVRLNSFIDGSKPNMSIGHATHGNFEISWRGPAIAVMTGADASDQENGWREFLDDMAMVDYRDIIDFFGFYGQWIPGQEDFAPESFWWLTPVLKEELASKRLVQAVKISCDVEQRHTGIKYSILGVQDGHPAVAFLQPCPITVKLGLPLIMRRIPVDERSIEEAEATGNTNFGPILLLLVVDPQSKHWGMAPETKVHGNMAVMRHDMKDLHPHHLEAMLMYIVQVVRPAMEESLDGKRERKEVLEMLHPSRYDWFFRFYRKEKAEKDKSWAEKAEKWAETPDLFEFPSLVSLMNVMKV